MAASMLLSAITLSAFNAWAGGDIKKKNRSAAALCKLHMLKAADIIFR